MLLARWLRVALPDDVPALILRLALGLVGFIALVWALVGRIPAAWLSLLAGNQFLLRALMLLSMVAILSVVRTIAFAALPRSPWLFRRTLRIRHRGRSLRLDVRDVVEIHLDRRPEPIGDMFVLMLKDGRELDLCPARWDGAGRLYAGIQRWIKWRARRESRQARRNRKK